MLPAFTGTVVAMMDGAEGAVDMADMGFVENGGAGRHGDVGVHGSSPGPRCERGRAMAPLSGGGVCARIDRGI
ncbi:MAG: hypothetical protein ABSD11_21205 [Methylocella sp.]